MATLSIAHRGGAALYPENTLAALRHAVALGCDGAELDVQLSRDGELVVVHDFRLKPELCREASGAWLKGSPSRIKDLTLAELRAFDVGRAAPGTGYSRTHPLLTAVDGERIPTLGEVIELARQARDPFWLFVELKTCFAERGLSADPRAMADATVRILREGDHLACAVLVGFDWVGLLHAKSLEPQLECWFSTLPQSWFRDGPPPRQDEPPGDPALQALRDWARTGASPWAAGYDAVSYGGSILRAMKAAGADGWFAMYRDVTSEAAAEARALGLKVGAWTVDSPADMRRLSALGVDAICSDRPDILRRIAKSG